MKLYDGSLNAAEFHNIRTSVDGSTGIQISKSLGVLTVRGGVTTTGDKGMSLTKGVQECLQASAVRIKPGGSVQHQTVTCALSTAGDPLGTLEVAGHILECAITGGVEATGNGPSPAKSATPVQLIGVTVVWVRVGVHISFAHGARERVRFWAQLRAAVA